MAPSWIGSRVLGRASNQKPKLYRLSAAIIVARAPVAQRIERRPPEPDRLGVVAALVGPRAKRAEFCALREALRGFARPPVFRLLAWRHTFKPMLCIAKAGLEPAPSRIYCYRGLPPAIATVGTAVGTRPCSRPLLPLPESSGAIGGRCSSPTRTSVVSTVGGTTLQVAIMLDRGGYPRVTKSLSRAASGADGP